MGIYDRDYMRADRPTGRKREPRPSAWKRLLFRLWLLLHGGGRGGR